MNPEALSLPPTSPSADVENTSSAKKIEKIALLDCGAQYAKVIDRRVRELNILTEIYPVNVPASELGPDISGVILSGGPDSVYAEGSPQCDPGIFELGVPVLGICYGMQLLNRHFGGSVLPSPTREYGETDITVDTDSLLFQGLDATQHVLMSHGDSVEQPAPGFRVMAHSASTHGHQVVAAIENADARLYGVQFHPEVDLSRNGGKMLENFLYRVCGLSGRHVLEDRLEETLEAIRQQVGEHPVFVLVSGGVDSSVTAALLVRALKPEQVYAVHIDSGMMRAGESDLVCEALKAVGLRHLERIDAEANFLDGVAEIDGRPVGPLRDVMDPEAKRRIIGDVFFHLVTEAIQRAGLDLDRTFIAQGTLRPDLIESGNRDISTNAQTIKTHHNDVPLIRAQREKGLIVEPNRDWHKDEVRRVGRLLGLPEALVMRHPFPGPGLGIRVLCAREPYLTEDDDAIRAQLEALVRPTGMEALLLPFRSVGVQGDNRSYRHAVALKADFSRHGWAEIQTIARAIPNRIRGVNRVALLLNDRPLPAAIRTITPTLLTHVSLEKLRVLDNMVTEAFHDAGLHDCISQLFSVLLPIGSEEREPDSPPRHSLAIRAVITNDYMTARPAALLDEEIPLPFIRDLAEKLATQPNVEWIFYDVTGKPPATVEWE